MDYLISKALHSWLTRVLYNRRSKFDPLWNTFVVAGLQDNEPYLGFVNLQGVAFTETLLATGMGVDLCLPVMRAAMEKKGGLLEYEEARTTLLQCIRLAYLRFFKSCTELGTYHLLPGTAGLGRSSTLPRLMLTEAVSRDLSSSIPTGPMPRGLLVMNRREHNEMYL